MTDTAAPSPSDTNQYSRPPGPAICPVIGIGASAGGLEGFEDFIRTARTGMGVAYVLVQHLDPNQTSLMPELIARRTELPVCAIEDGMLPAPDQVFLLPPNRALRIENGVLRLDPFDAPRGKRRPIDSFFRSLAQDQGTNAGCVILSGTGSDGSDGLRSVKDAGGLAIVQDPAQAKYDGMPVSAIATGVVDLVLPADAIPPALDKYFNQTNAAGDEAATGSGDFLTRICEAVRRSTGHDFSNYKIPTMRRRIAQRMKVVALEDPAAYLRRLATDPAEPELLLRDLLINVTSFFRDPEAFDILRSRVLPELMSAKPAHETFRVWVPGCSSGEEAYSIAILLMEQAARAATPRPVSVFATDIDTAMLNTARAARYPFSAVADVPPELLERYFIADDRGYRLNQKIRDSVRVSEHSLIKDPPFSRVDMISCRNLLIYLDNRLQQRVIPTFHNALRRGGALFLGPAENLAGHDALFDVTDERHKIFRKRSDVTARIGLLPVHPMTKTTAATRHHDAGSSAIDEDAVRRRVIENYAPTFVVVSEGGEILYAYGRTARYFEMGHGRPTLRLLDLAREGLRSALRILLKEYAIGSNRVALRDVISTFEDRQLRIDITAEKLDDGTALMVFQEHDRAAPDDSAEDVEDVAGTRFSEEVLIRELEDELAETRHSLRATVEDLETSNEELKSSNEEMMSMNEELQSANEALSTLNTELKQKVGALNVARNDMRNLLESTQIVSVFLDAKLRIRDFTPEAERVIGFQRADTGREISDINTRADSETLARIGRETLRTLRPYEGSIPVRGETHDYLLRAFPYRSEGDSIDGVVFVLTDVSDIAQTADALEEARREAESRHAEIERVYQQTPVAMGLLDLDLNYVRMNEHMARLGGITSGSAIGRPISQASPALAAEVGDLARHVIAEGAPMLGEAVEVMMEPGAPRARILETDWYPYVENGAVEGVGFAIQDVTDTRERDEQLEVLMHELQHRVKNVLANVIALTRQAKRSTHGPEAALVQLESRLNSMAKSNNLLSLRNWRSADLAALVEAELHDVYGSNRITAKGPQIELNAAATLAFAMALHEMSTNAAKYGALSVAEGKIDVRWMFEDRGDGPMLALCWVETGGPEPAAPDKKGFGTNLINASFARTLSGSIERSFPPEGVIYDVRVPLGEVREKRANANEVPGEIDFED